MIYQKCIIAYIKINGHIWHWEKQTFIFSFKKDVIAKNLPVEGAILQQSAFMGSFSSSSCPHLHTSAAACCVLSIFGLLD